MNVLSPVGLFQSSDALKAYEHDSYCPIIKKTKIQVLSWDVFRILSPAQKKPNILLKELPLKIEKLF